MIYLLLVTNVLSLATVYWLVRKNLRVIDALEEVNDRIEESLDILDNSYAKLSKLLETPVLFDDPVVVEMVESAKSARDAILVVANKIVEQEEESERPED